MHKPALRIGVVLSVLWVVLLLGFWLLVPVRNETETGGILRLVVAIGAIMPLILIWMTIAFAQKTSDLRDECENLRAELEQLSQRAKTSSMGRSMPRNGADQPQPHGPPATAATSLQPTPSSALRRAPEKARRSAALPGQASMDFDIPSPTQIPAETLVLALNFPNDANDRETIAALRAALKDPETARVLRAAQDVVTLLANHGVFMDDLPPEHVPASIWRQFSEGDRSKTAARIGGIHDEGALDIVTNLLRSDEIFRDTAHHFLRHFDTMLSRDLPYLADTHVTALADTRSARSFMLIGRAAGVFRQAEA